MPTQPLRHVAIIMDGNRRWAAQRGLPASLGHRAGIERIKSTVEVAIQYPLEVLTLFAFSIENWQRSPEEVNYLLQQLLVATFDNELASLHSSGVRVTIVGELSRLGEKIRAKLQIAEELTKANQGLHLIVALSYGGRWDISNAFHTLYDRLSRQELAIGDINEQTIGEQLAFAQVVDPDLMIRTSGEKRLSNFMLWQLAYTELYFTDVLWPDFTKREFIRALQYYETRERRFGKC